MASRNGYNQRRSDLKFELDKRTDLLEEKVGDQNLRTEAISALRDLYSSRIATTYVNEASHKFASEGLTRKDIDNIHRHILNIQHIPHLFVNDVYDIVHSPEAKIDEDDFQMKVNKTIGTSQVSAKTSEGVEGEIKRLQGKAALLEEKGKLLETNTSICKKEIAELKDDTPKLQAEIAALQKEKNNGWGEAKSTRTKQ
ncbi:hypothetical protein BOTCAL_0116g00120 [Botryotinia calthae]|uniref:Uncharacterized protein n=1 Tax=Botryotinia calthae TaxID=38488 RepID=A0A4Y8D4X6_9HELO|nr:hypothetical protein BOTCAL_0116g00120 [Botryotinia calthae]